MIKKDLHESYKTKNQRYDLSELLNEENTKKCSKTVKNHAKQHIGETGKRQSKNFTQLGAEMDTQIQESRQKTVNKK